MSVTASCGLPRVGPNKREIYSGSVQREGLTLIPLRMYFNNRGLAKIALGLGRGKREYDKRQDIKQRDWNRRKATILRNEG